MRDTRLTYSHTVQSEKTTALAPDGLETPEDTFPKRDSACTHTQRPKNAKSIDLFLSIRLFCIHIQNFPSNRPMPYLSISNSVPRRYLLILSHVRGPYTVVVVVARRKKHLIPDRVGLCVGRKHKRALSQYNTLYKSLLNYTI